MKSKIFYISFLFFFVASIPSTGFGNSNTKEYCEQLMKLSEDERVKTNYSKALEYLTEVKMIAEQNNWLDTERQSVGRMAFVYADMMDYDKAMEYHIESYNISVRLSNKEGELTALNNIGLMCFESGKMEECWKYGKKAYSIAVELNDSLRIAQLAINLASLANITDNIPLSEKYIQIAFNMLGNKNDFWEVVYIELVMIDNFFKKEEYDKAEQLALSILKNLENIEYESEKFQKKAYKNIKPNLLVRLSTIYEKKNDCSKAISFAQQALHDEPTIKEEIGIYEQLSILFRAKQAFDSAFAYKDSVIVKKNALSKIINNNNLESNRIKFDLLNSEKELAENKAKQKAERTLFIVIFIGVFVLLLVFFWIFRLKSIKNKQQKTIELEKEKNEKLLLEQQLTEQKTFGLLEQERLNNEKLLLEEKLQKQETLALLEQERLNNEIEAKNSQLTAKILSHSNRYEWIKEILESLLEIPDKSRNSTLESIIRKLKLELTDSVEWNNFLTHFEQMNSLLLSSIKRMHPHLTANDIQLLACIYLDLDTKKTTYLLNISVVAYLKKKQRLAGKMGLKVSELHSYLKNIATASGL